MKTFTFTVPGPPVGKERPRKGQHGNFYTPPKTKAYEEQIAMFAKAEGVTSTDKICHLDVKWRTDPETGEQELEVSLVQTDDTPLKKRRPDGDNVLKAIGDALQGVGYENDSQIDWWSISREGEKI